jgi:hypothetical protein
MLFLMRLFSLFSNPSSNVVDHNSLMGNSSFYWNTNHLCDLQSNPVDAAGTDLPPPASFTLADTDMGAPIASPDPSGTMRYSYC